VIRGFTDRSSDPIVNSLDSELVVGTGWGGGGEVGWHVELGFSDFTTLERGGD